jgi:predicted TIM-barrel enzyme
MPMDKVATTGYETGRRRDTQRSQWRDKRHRLRLRAGSGSEPASISLVWQITSGTMIPSRA